jgi:hypothetical protein
MAFKPRYRLIPRIIRQIKAIERTAGMFEAVRMKPEWITFFSVVLPTRWFALKISWETKRNDSLS